MYYCLGLGFYCCIETLDEKQVREERFYLAHTSTSSSFSEGSQGRNSNKTGTWNRELMQRPWQELLTGLFHMTCSAYSLIELRTTSLGTAPPTVHWACAVSHLLRNCLTHKYYAGIFSSAAPSFTMGKTDMKLSRTTMK